MSYSFTGDWVHDLDRWLTTDPRDEEEPVYYCCSCGEGIFEGEDYYKIGSDNWCSECIDNCKAVAEFEEPDYPED